MPFSFHRAALVVLVAAVALAACSVRLISPYDEETDRAVADLHRRTERLLLDLERTAGTPQGTHAAFADRYADLTADFRALQIRAESRPDNAIQAEQIGLLVENLALMETAHREGMQAEEVPLFRRGFEQSFRAIVTLELAKKRGAD